MLILGFDTGECQPGLMWPEAPQHLSSPGALKGMPAHLNELGAIRGGVLALHMEHAHCEAHALDGCHAELAQLALLGHRQDAGAVRPCAAHGSPETGLCKAPGRWSCMQVRQEPHQACAGDTCNVISGARGHSSMSHLGSAPVLAKQKPARLGQGRGLPVSLK